jgi:hypothetical protein
MTWTEPFTFSQLLRRGIILGNALEARSEGAWGVTPKADYFEGRR